MNISGKHISILGAVRSGVSAAKLALDNGAIPFVSDYSSNKDVLEKVGLLDEKLFLYYEDTNWSIRVKQAGFKAIYNPKSIIWHKNAGSTKGSGSDIQIYYQTRNRIHFGLKHAPFKSILALIKESVRSMFKGSLIEKKAITHALTNQYGKRHGK